MQWDRWLKRRSSSARDHLIVAYAPLVKFVAGRVGAGLPASVDPGDLVSSGVLGLIDAIERFDPTAGVKFETFADAADPWRDLRRAARARLGPPLGAVEGTRGRAGDRRPRGPPRSGADRRRARRPPPDQSRPARQWLSSIASTTIGPLERALDVGAEPRALSGEVPIVPSAVVEDREVREVMRAEIDKLPEREKLVLSLYYDEGLTLAQISRVLGVSESRVPQIHTKSVLHLRARMAAAGVA